MAAAFDVSEVIEAAAWLQDVADQLDSTLEEPFAAWSDEVLAIMQDEVPKLTWEMHDSITVERDGLTATIGPTNVDEKGRPIGFFVNFGAGNRDPDDFVGRTADRAREVEFDVDDVL